MQIAKLGAWLLGLATLLGLAGCEQIASSSSTGANDLVIENPPTDAALCQRLDRVIAFNRTHRPMNQQVNAAWQVVHGILAYGPELQMRVDGKLVSALDYLLAGGTLRGWDLRKGDHGLKAIGEPGSKTGMGHADQWLGYMSQIGLSLDHPIKVGDQQYTVADLLSQAQWDIYPGMEATWTLMATSTYLPSDATWQAKDGSQWSIERIVDNEARENIDASACGGSHRLYGLAVALNRHLEQGGKLTGGWLQAEQTIQAAVTKAHAYQQPDGTFSTNYFSRPSTSPDIALRLNTSGHTFEFLTVALDDEQFLQPWMTRALLALLDLFERTEDLELECGGLYHALHGLELYRLRRFGPVEPDAASSNGSAKTTATASGTEIKVDADDDSLPPVPPAGDAAK